MTRPVPVAIAAPGLPLADPVDRATFAARKLAHLDWERNVLAPGALALAQVAYDNAEDANGSAVSALAAAATAEAGAVSAQVAVNAPLWVTGTTYTIGFIVWSPANGRIYRRRTDGAGAVDPSADPTNWLFVSPLMMQVTESRATAAISAGVLALDLVHGVTSVALNANITSITFANNIASASAVQCHTLEFVANGSAYTVAWPNGNGTSTLLVKHVAGNTPTLTTTSGKRDTFFLKSVSQYLWDCYIVGQNT